MAFFLFFFVYQDFLKDFIGIFYNYRFFFSVCSKYLREVQKVKTALKYKTSKEKFLFNINSHIHLTTFSCHVASCRNAISVENKKI